MSHDLHFMMGRSLAQQERLLEAVTEIRGTQVEIRREVKLLSHQQTRQGRRIERLEESRPSTAATWVKLGCIPLLPLLALIPSEKLQALAGVWEILRPLLAR